MTVAKQQPPLYPLEPLCALTGYVPHAAQKAVHDSTARMRVVAAGRRGGKSHCCKFEALRAALVPVRGRRRVWILAPTLSQARYIFDELRDLLLEHFREMLTVERWSDLYCEVRTCDGGTCEIAGRSAEQPSRLRGAGVDMLIVDEAAHIPDHVWGLVEPMLLSTKGRCVLISSPRGSNWFRQCYDRGVEGPNKLDDYESFRFTSYDNPNNDPVDLRKLASTMPHSVYQQELLAEWVDADGAVFSGVHECATLRWPSPDGIPAVPGDSYTRGDTYFVGVDLAKARDATVAVVLDSAGRVVFIDRTQGMDWAVQVDRIAVIARRYNNATCLVDTTGVGAAVFELFQKTDVRAKPFVLTPQSKPAIVNFLAAQIEQRRVQLPRPGTSKAADALLDELRSYSFKRTRDGAVKTEAPGAGHDDCVIALALALEAARGLSPARMQFASVDLSPERVAAPVTATGIQAASIDIRNRMDLDGRLGRLFGR